VTAWAPSLFAAVCGLALGSYAVTSGLRLTQAPQLRTSRSRCDHCGHRLGAAETTPIASYVWLHGACRHCGGRIDPVHPLGEVAGALVLSLTPWAVDPVRGALITAIGLLLIAASVVDARTLRLPDILTGSVGVAAASMAAMRGWPQLATGLAAALATAGILLTLRTLPRRAERPSALGLGDVKLAAALALWVGWATPLMILTASLLGLAAAPFGRDAHGRIAFGPMLAVSGWLVGVATEHGWSAWVI
jgi:leader peptidase (prepilin peptidase)/N-methyltransferase